MPSRDIAHTSASMHKRTNDAGAEDPDIHPTGLGRAFGRQTRRDRRDWLSELRLRIDEVVGAWVQSSVRRKIARLAQAAALEAFIHNM